MHAERNVKQVVRWCLYIVLGFPLLNSCKDDDIYDNEEPSWLGANIYEYLESSGQFDCYLALVNDLGYKETLRLTGSKTMFPYILNRSLTPNSSQTVRSTPNIHKYWHPTNSVPHYHKYRHPCMNSTKESLTRCIGTTSRPALHFFPHASV